MLKSTIVIFCVVLTIIVRDCESASILDMFVAESCPQYSSMSDLDFKKFTEAGVWYDLANNDPDFDELKCTTNLFKINSNGTLQLDFGFILVDGTSTVTPIYYDIDESDSGDFTFEQEVEDKSIFGVDQRKIDVRLSTVYTDYENIVVFYQCYETKMNFVPQINQKGYILVKNRSFDSLSQFVSGVARLKRLGIDVDDLEFIYNGPECTN